MFRECQTNLHCQTWDPSATCNALLFRSQSLEALCMISSYVCGRRRFGKVDVIRPKTASHHVSIFCRPDPDLLRPKTSKHPISGTRVVSILDEPKGMMEGQKSTNSHVERHIN